MNLNQGYNYIMAGHYDEAISQIRQALEIAPELGYSYLGLGLALELKGDVAGALAEFKRARQLSDDPSILAVLGNLYGKTGNRAEGAKILTELEHLAKKRYVPAYVFAVLQVGLGNKTEALRWLEKSYTDRESGDITSIKVNPLLEPLHGDPRFEALVQKVFSKQ
jgi:tetratricopeptide (TPR) repeat protein